MSRKKKEKRTRANKGEGESKLVRYLTLESPLLGMTEEERTKFRDETGKFHSQQFEQAMRQLEEVATSADPIYILTQLVVSNLYAPISASNRTPASSFKPDIPQPGIELYQAMVLRATSSDAFSSMPIQIAISQLYELLPRILESFGMLRMASYNGLVSDQERAIFRLQECLRLHTAMIRNWGYYEQSLNILRLLYGEIDEELRRATSISPISVIDTFDYLIRRAEREITGHGGRLRTTIGAKGLEDIVSAYYRAFVSDDTDKVEFLSYCAREGIGAEEAKDLLIYHSYEYLSEAFRINTEVLAGELKTEPVDLERILDATSIQRVKI